MKPFTPCAVAFFMASCLPLTALAQTGPPLSSPPAAVVIAPLAAQDIELKDFLWTARPLVIFADTPADPRFKRQLELLAARPKELAARHIVVITDSSPDPLSALREKLRPRGFTWVLIDKDGAILLRKPLPWHVRELINAIDKTPLRLQEIKEFRDIERKKLGE